MRIIVTSDLQWAENPRDDYRHAFVDQLKKVIRKNKPDYLFILGDLTEEKDNHSAWLVNKIVQHLYELSDICRLLIMRGNHDYKDIQYPFFEFVKRFEGIKWISTPQTYKGMQFLPHTRNYKDDWNPEWFNGPMIFAHNIFEGVHSGSGHKLKGIPTNIFPKGSRVYSGDVHEPQVVGPVTYVGSPYLCDYGDDYEPRLIMLDEGKEISIPVTGPQKRLVECVAGRYLDEDDNLEWVREQFDKVNEGDILKLRVILTTEQMAKWGALKKSMQAWADKHGMILDTIQPIVNYKAGKVAPQYQQKSDEDHLIEYAKRRGLDENTVKAGLQIMDDDR